MGTGAPCHYLTSFPPGNTQYPYSGRLDRPKGHSGWMHTILLTDIQSQYCPAHSETHLYEYISLTRRFIQNKIQKKHSKRQMILGKGEAGQRVFNRHNKIWKYSIKLCCLRNNLLYILHSFCNTSGYTCIHL